MLGSEQPLETAAAHSVVGKRDCKQLCSGDCTDSGVQRILLSLANYVMSERATHTYLSDVKKWLQQLAKRLGVPEWKHR